MRWVQLSLIWHLPHKKDFGNQTQKTGLHNVVQALPKTNINPEQDVAVLLLTNPAEQSKTVGQTI